MGLVTKLFAFAVLLLSVARGNVNAASDSTRMVRKEQNDGNSLRQRQPASERRLFYWGNLLYTLHICNSGSDWCPDPHCDGPLKPPGCHKKSSGGGSSSGGSSSSSSSSSTRNGGGGNAVYANSEGESAEVYSSEAGENGDSYIGDGAAQGSSARTQSRFNYFWYIAAAAGVASLVGVFLVKKNGTNAEDDLDHQLNQSVAKRLERLLAGKSVPSIDGASLVGPSFVGVGKDAPALTPEALPKSQNLYEEPDDEAIEMRLDDKIMGGKYVNMAEV